MKTITYQRVNVSACRRLGILLRYAHTPIRRYVVTALFAFSLQSSAFALEPASATVTNLREEAESYVSQCEFYRGAPILLTNCIALAGPLTNSPRQDLTGLTMTVSIGTTSTNMTFAATAANATSGTWWARFNVPTNWESPKLQLKLTNSTDVFIYPWKILKTKSPL